MSVAAGQLIRSFRQLMGSDVDTGQPVVTLFSGGLDSSYLLLRLRERGFRDVHAVTVDLGEDESTTYKQDIADRLGVQLHVVDRREEFAEEFVCPAIAAQAVYLDTHPVSSTLSRPLIARTAMDVADEMDARMVLHTANRSQNTLRRLNGSLRLLRFCGAFGSPYDLEPVDRDDKMLELKRAGIGEMTGRLVSGDSNLWCREFESGILDDPEDHLVPEDLYRWSVPIPGRAPEELVVEFDGGRPIAVDGRHQSLPQLIAELNVRVGAFGLGRFSGLEHLDHGEKVLEIREMPAAWLLLRSYRHLELATLSAEYVREKMHLEQLWVREALEGRWFGELHEALRAFVAVCASRITGSITWRLDAAGAQTRAIVAAGPRYIRDREAWERLAIADECRPHVLT